jgi:hypothetical protein
LAQFNPKESLDILTRLQSAVWKLKEDRDLRAEAFPQIQPKAEDFLEVSQPPLLEEAKPDLRMPMSIGSLELDD